MIFMIKVVAFETTHWKVFFKILKDINFQQIFYFVLSSNLIMSSVLINTQNKGIYTAWSHMP